MNASSTPPPLPVTTKLSARSVPATVARLTELIATRGLKLFAVIDQQAEARHVGLELRATTLVMFGSPLLGTPVMAAAPLAALELPLKVLIWADGDQTKLCYLSPEALAVRQHLTPELAHNLQGIDAITDQLVLAPT
jgi:uncharacterized protein (DUF302 family)